MRDLKVVGVYSVCHLIVDMLCSFLLLGVLSKYQSTNANFYFYSILLYNFCAFVLQYPFGIFVDTLNKNGLVSMCGMLLVVLALCIGGITGVNLIFIPSLIAGIGNALFHLGGGVDVLNIADKKAKLSGIYVSTGALGLFLGGVLGYTKTSYLILLGVGLLSSMSLYWVYKQIKIKYNINNDVYEFKCNSDLLKGIVYFIFLAVCLRSFTGFVVSFEWKTGIVIGLITTLCIVLGKMLGGILGDKIGWKRLSIISLLLSSICFYFSPINIYCGLLALFFFNMTMPLTLSVLSNTFQGAKGTVFGITTSALFVGYFVNLCITSYFQNISYLLSGLVLLVCSVVSLIVMLIGLTKYEQLK